ncbi:MAG: rod shape-determining protein MreD [bacterium]|jgi:rod shape-determining protein MreD|nr:rod shape-determining protein MreD [Bacillota bacterium]HHW54794.1 rod shape-determining protein MreD [Bacillota bacterium]
MKRVDYLILFLLVLSCLVLQSTFLASFAPYGLIPDLILIMVVSIALIRGSWEGAVWGFLAGLGLDMISSSYLGFHALTKMVVGFFFGLVEEKVFKENLLLPAVVLFMASIVHELLFLALAVFYRQMEINFFSALRGIILPLSLYNALLAPFVYVRLLGWYRSRSRYPGERKGI